MISIKIKSIYGGLPEYSTKESAGCDLQNWTGDVLLSPGERFCFSTGVYLQIPEGYEGQVRGRSGLNKNFGLVVPVGTIDSDYRGEVKVVLYNLSREPYQVKKGDRIAQLVFSPVVQASWKPSDTLEDTERGEGGFGHTGV